MGKENREEERKRGKIKGRVKLERKGRGGRRKGEWRRRSRASRSPADETPAWSTEVSAMTKTRLMKKLGFAPLSRETGWCENRLLAFN